MVRGGLTVLFLGATLATQAQDLGRVDHLWKVYLSETVRRGLPVLGSSPPSSVPAWPGVDRALVEARSLEPGPDTDLLGAWIDVQEGNRDEGLRQLQDRWPPSGLVRFTTRQWGEALFTLWSPGNDPRAWTDAWLAWENKAYSPRTLVRGLEVLETIDPSAVEPLLVQARRLYPEDRRFVALALAHTDAVPSVPTLVHRDLVQGGWSDATLGALLSRHPAVRGLLVAAGYPAERLASVQGRDYGVWVSQAEGTPPPDGGWVWDADQDGRPESRIVFSGGLPVTWTRSASDGGVWTLGLTDGRPDVVTEARQGTSWTLRYDGYPVASTLEYRWGTSTLVYRFPPAEVEVPLAPSARFEGPPGRLPAVLAELWLPLDPRLLAQKAASLETWDAGVRVQTVFLSQGQTWLVTEDVNRDGIDDRWSYFRSGRLSSVYSDLGGRGQATLRELYDRGELSQVQARSPQGPRPEVVLFPQEGVQLWDPHGQSRPLDRIFQWSGGRLDALVFTGTELPWETMPRWEPRP